MSVVRAQVLTGCYVEHNLSLVVVIQAAPADNTGDITR